MNRKIIFTGILILAILISCTSKERNPFWNDGKELFDVQKIFDGGQHPNIVVAKDGSIIATFGKYNYKVRRSEDGGNTWSPTKIIADPGFQGGGATVNEYTGDIFLFSEETHPPAPLHVFKSIDHGKTWQEIVVTIHPDSRGNVPSMHMNEHGITLQHGEYAGRLLRPARYYAGSNDRENWPNHYTTAIYSDDDGKTWHTSEPFPAMGTGEAAVAELSDGTIYYNSRRHYSYDGLNPRMRHIAWSYDGGETWEDLEVSDELPDGAQHVDYGLMAGLVRLEVEGHDILLFSNIDEPVEEIDREVPHEERTTLRQRGTIWASFDGGKTWPVKRLVTEGSFGYSSLTAGRKGTPSEGWIYLLYEEWDQPRPGHVVRFNLDWLTDGRDWKKFLPENQQ